MKRSEPYSVAEIMEVLRCTRVNAQKLIRNPRAGLVVQSEGKAGRGHSTLVTADSFHAYLEKRAATNQDEADAIRQHLDSVSG